LINKDLRLQAQPNYHGGFNFPKDDPNNRMSSVHKKKAHPLRGALESTSTREAMSAPAL
jgi:hypothetical protein